MTMIDPGTAPESSAVGMELQQVFSLQRGGRQGEAERRAARLLAVHPDEPAVHRAMAVLAQHDGRGGMALQFMRNAVQLAPQSGLLRLEMGQLLVSCGDVRGALDAFRQAVAQEPGLVDGWLLLGMTLYRAKDDQEALRALRHAHVLAVDRHDVVRALAEVEFSLESFETALPLFAELFVAFPCDVDVTLRLGKCHSRCGFAAKALELFRDAVVGAPASADLWLALAQAEEDTGDHNAALGAYQRAHDLRPGWADPLGGLLMLHRGDAPAALIDRATALLQEKSVQGAQRSYLYYALGKVHDARGDYQQAMAHWREANRTRRSGTGGLDVGGLRRRVTQTRSAFTPLMFESAAFRGRSYERPIFVVGMPRSGTTLVEQIIATHPQAAGCGELIEMGGIAASLAARLDLRWPEDVAGLDAETLSSLARQYLVVATRRADAKAKAKALRLVDKQPYNFFHLGLAALLFPRAHFIWCRRDPRDISLSIFSENFAAESTFATDFSDIRELIAAQAALMRHWQAVLPNRILEVRYEDLVADIEPQSRRIIESIGLPWNEDCLRFHANPRAVQTFSRWQVRQPVHSRSVQRWRNYSQWMPTDGDEE
ncbi:MAG: tetratricopeptide repeat-containing sulfotransferase family protein [Lysobacter sp.]